MIKYYKLFDLLNRRGMKKSDLREILAPKTIAKLSKGANLNTDVIDKICLYLKCQPSDIMEVIEWETETSDGSSIVYGLSTSEEIPINHEEADVMVEEHTFFRDKE